MRHRSIAVLVVLGLVGCAQTNARWSDSGPEGLAGLRTFHVAPAAANPDATVDSSPEVWRRRHAMIRDMIRADLASKGYQASAGGEPDFVVHVTAGIHLKSGAFTYTATSREGEIDIHVTRPGTSRWLWHGWATTTITQRLDRDETIREMVTEILSKFPQAS